MQHELNLPSQEWEFDFSNPPKVPPPAIHCKHCNQEVPQPFFVVKHFGYITHQFAFCNEQHANEYYLNKLRESSFE